MKPTFFIFIPFFMISFSPGEGMNDTLSQQEETEEFRRLHAHDVLMTDQVNGSSQSEMPLPSLSREDAIQRAQEYLYFNDNKFKEMIEILEPLLSSDTDGSASFLYAEALSQLKPREESIKWYINAGKLGNSESLTLINSISPKTYELIQHQKIEDAQYQYKKDLAKFFETK
ncbi:MAG: hypothetical protein B7Y25_02150 [Alphaproteobacteria bacterium 16-39-46]|nr:MAG: hypothetical protein B7Y25_02150 [Alphaproteobacteria bacterium 16-39-46]OZA43707.1 MAG: hypothetical protein B7X84_02400 [Alphaproteobacteria bacterium 17-39-52]HQS83641.1 hypothetical protein [Alphaproteobacteria bacterium]HQS93568.1 hypothetical protein [Alphaproteobacteria bacterium]